MATPETNLYFVEVSEYALLAARAEGKPGAFVIQEVRESMLDGAGEMIASIFQQRTEKIVCALRVNGRFFHFATGDEARQLQSTASAEEFLKRTYAQKLPAEIVLLSARTGDVGNRASGSPLLLVGAPQSSVTGALEKLKAWGVDPVRVGPASSSILGAISIQKSASPILVWDISDATSHLFLVKSDGIASVQALSVGLDQVIEAVQAELNLKFKGSATKLFFNEFYDFSEIGPKIATRIAAALQPSLNKIATAGQPTHLHIAGLPAKQLWLTQYLSGAFSFAPYAADFTAWSASSGVTFANADVSSSLSTPLLGLLGTVATFDPQNSLAEPAWQPRWLKPATEKPVEVATPPAPTPPT